MEEISFFNNLDNPSLTHQEVVLDVVSEPPTNKSSSLTAAIINVANNANLSAKLTITQEELSIAYSTTHI